MGFLDDCPLKLAAEVPVSLGVHFDFAAVRYSAGDMSGKIHRRHIQYLSSQTSQSSKERLCVWFENRMALSPTRALDEIFRPKAE